MFSIPFVYTLLFSKVQVLPAVFCRQGPLVPLVRPIPGWKGGCLQQEADISVMLIYIILLYMLYFIGHWSGDRKRGMGSGHDPGQTQTRVFVRLVMQVKKKL